MILKQKILELSRQNQIRELSPFLSDVLDQAIASGTYADEAKLEEINEFIISQTMLYREVSGRDVVVLGMSGGVDSALTAAIFGKAGYHVVGVTMPINQDPVETERGVEACQALGIEHQHIDLSDLYSSTVRAQSQLDSALSSATDERSVRVRLGNIRARLRMVTLYNLASARGGMVASTDNLSELAAGFWTLHGDVGDFSPIPALLKSWEVPSLARLNGVPESTVTATPTDGLGIAAGDEAQLGCSYLEWDLMVYALATGTQIPDTEERVRTAVMNRMNSTWFKRRNPLRVPHPFEDRYALIDAIDRRYFVPKDFQ